MNVNSLGSNTLAIMAFYVVVAILAGIATYFHLLAASTFNDVVFVVLGLIFPTSHIVGALNSNTAATQDNTKASSSAPAPVVVQVPAGTTVPGVSTNPAPAAPAGSTNG